MKQQAIRMSVMLWWKGDGGNIRFKRIFPSSLFSSNFASWYKVCTKYMLLAPFLLAAAYPTQAQVAGTIATVAGNGQNGNSGDGGQATSASISQSVVALDSSGNLYIAYSAPEDYLGRVRKVSASGIITTVAGGGKNYPGDGGRAIDAELVSIQSIALDSAGNLYISDRSGSRIHKVGANGIITTIAGGGQVCAFSGDGGPAVAAQLCNPIGIAFDTQNNLYIADLGNSRIRKISAGGIISTIAGNGASCIDDSSVCGDGGPATAAAMSPLSVAVSAAGEVYFADSNDRVRKISSAGVVMTVAGSGRAYNPVNDLEVGDGQPATQAYLGPSGVAIDGSGNLYIADTTVNNRIRRVGPDGIISSVAGNGNYGYSGEGGPATRAAITPDGSVAVDAAGSVYLSANYRLLRVFKPIAGGNTGGGGGILLRLDVGDLRGNIPVNPGDPVPLYANFSLATGVSLPCASVQFYADAAVLGSAVVSCANLPPGAGGGSSCGTSWTAKFAQPGTHQLYAMCGSTQSNSVDVIVNNPTSTTDVNLNQHGLTGSWGRSNAPGTRQGFLFNFYPDNITPGHGTVFAGWYTYDVAGGNSGQRWYALQGDVYSNSASASLAIYTGTDGNLNSGSKPASSQVGTATLSFSDCSTGTLAYSFNDGRSGSIPLSRVTHSTATCGASGDTGADAQNYSLSGAWIVTNAVGMGFVIDVSPADKTLLGSWYTYFPAGNLAPSPRQQWFVFQDSNFAPTQTSSNNIPLLQASGGIFDATVGGGVTTSTAGSVSLTFTSCTTATFTYAISTESVSRNTVNLVRLGPAPAGCKL